MKEATYELKPTFDIISKNDQPAIKCLMCGMISYNYNDILYKYCGKCDVFHETLFYQVVDHEEIIKANFSPDTSEEIINVLLKKKK